MYSVSLSLHSTLTFMYCVLVMCVVLLLCSLRVAYFSHISKLNALMVMSQQLNTDAMNPAAHKYSAHQLALLYVSGPHWMSQPAYKGFLNSGQLHVQFTVALCTSARCVLLLVIIIQYVVVVTLCSCKVLSG